MVPRHRRRAVLFEFIIGGDDLLHQRMAHHVACRQTADGDILDALQHTHGLLEAADLIRRKIDKATDVLSFPMFDLTPGVLPESWEKYEDPGTGLVPLGDMAISLERAEQQAKEFGHSTKREVGYLTIHSVLHLLGYDHMDEGEMKRQMREREEAILAEIELTR